jgi:hypothetical protein
MKKNIRKKTVSTMTPTLAGYAIISTYDNTSYIINKAASRIPGIIAIILLRSRDITAINKKQALTHI